MYPRYIQSCVQTPRTLGLIVWLLLQESASKLEVISHYNGRGRERKPENSRPPLPLPLWQKRLQ